MAPALADGDQCCASTGCGVRDYHKISKSVRGIRLDVEKGKALLSFSGDWPVVRGLALGDRPGLVPSPVVRLVNLVASY